MCTSKKEAYAILDLSPNCKLKEIEKSYKKLALEWLPQKHSYSALANEKFKQITQAYCTLVTEEKKRQEMNMSEMVVLFHKVFFKESTPFESHDLDDYPDYLTDSDDSDDEDDDDGDEYDDQDDEYSVASDDIEFSSCHRRLLEAMLQTIPTAKEFKEKEDKAQKNAMELVAEEEKEKRKSEKRRAKKKRRKMKKQQLKQEEQKKTDIDKTVEEKAQASNSSGSEEEGLDPSSAFVSVVANKKLVGNSLSSRKRNGLLNKRTNDAQDNTNLQNIDPIVLKSRQLAISGNQMASMNEYAAAISLFTAAIKLDPQDFRYFGNRSYCYERTQQYDRAIKDADRAICIAPTWPKGHFRKGRALYGLKRYAEAEECYQEVVKLDKNCSEAFTELISSRTAGIMEMGFSRILAETAATKYDNLQTAVNALVAESTAASQFNRGSDWGGKATVEVYQSDEEEDAFSAQGNKNINLKDVKMDSRNPHNQTSLWVGNLKKEATEKSITNLFGKYGELVSVRLLTESRCAFVNYKTARSASRGMEALQGFEYFGEFLLIRFPDHQHASGQTPVTFLKKKIITAKTKPKESTSTFDFKGPVNGDECYFWRMSGCIHGTKCRYKHVPKHKGVDLK